MRDFNIVVTGGVTGNAELETTSPLNAWIRNGLLHVKGLAIGEPWSVYSASGALIYKNIASQEEADIPLEIPGVYIIQSGDNVLKVVFEN